ncbi:DUF4400 domain-containing protein [Variovorax gossypii]
MRVPEATTVPIIEVKNNFARHSLLWWFVLPFAAVLVIPMFFPESTFHIASSELDFFTDWGRNVTEVSATADGIFKAAFIDTKIAKYFSEFFVLPHSVSWHSEAAQKSAAVSQNFNNAFWMMIYRGIWRCCALWPIYIGIFFSMVLPAFVDGLVTRAKKSFNFRFHNPVYFYSSMHTVVLVLGLGVFIPLMPVTLNAFLLSTFAGLLALAFWVTAANFQTGN